MSLKSVEDNQALPILLNPLRRTINQVSADGEYDIKYCYQLLKQKQAIASSPPRKNAGYWEDGHIRNKTVDALKASNLSEWKRESGYHKRSLSETAMYRYKTLIGNRLSLRCHDAQVAEVLLGVKALNKVIGLGMPERREIQSNAKAR